MKKETGERAQDGQKVTQDYIDGVLNGYDFAGEAEKYEAELKNNGYTSIPAGYLSETVFYDGRDGTGLRPVIVKGHYVSGGKVLSGTISVAHDNFGNNYGTAGAELGLDASLFPFGAGTFTTVQTNRFAIAEDAAEDVAGWSGSVSANGTGIAGAGIDFGTTGVTGQTITHGTPEVGVSAGASYTFDLGQDFDEKMKWTFQQYLQIIYQRQ